MRKFLRKNLNLIKSYGIFGLLFIYIKTLNWYLDHILASEATKCKKIKINNYDMYINLKDRGISKALFIYGVREKDQMYIIKNNLPAGAKVLDIGANIGYYVILESKIVGSSGKIIAYEPAPENYLLLKKNIELNNLNGRVEINSAAVSNKSGVNRFYLSNKSNLHTLNPQNYKSRAEKVEKPKFIDIETVDIYEIINKHRDIKFIRMDIEGHEVEVLDGLAMAMRDFGVYPDVLFETHFRKYDPINHNIKDRLERLFGLGYFTKFITSTDKRTSEFKKRGYKPKIIISTDMVNKGIYEGVSKNDTIDFICNIEGAGAVLLKREDSEN